MLCDAIPCSGTLPQGSGASGNSTCCDALPRLIVLWLGGRLEMAVAIGRMLGLLIACLQAALRAIWGVHVEFR